MKKSLAFLQYIGFVFTSVTGVVLHFLYDLSGQNTVVSLFSAVNESIWEHMKLLFFPLFVYALIENHYIGKDYENYWCVKLAGTVLGIALIPVLYYSYTGILGTSADWFNITIFFIAEAATYLLETKLLKSGRPDCKHPRAAFITLCLIVAVFVLFTFVQPQIPLFKDPVTSLYGAVK